MVDLYSPLSETELSDVIRSHASTGAKLKIIGGGTRPIGNQVHAENTITTKKMAGISLYEPGALTVVADAGTSLETLNQALASENQHLPFEPANYNALLGTKGHSTIGGVVAAAVSGPRRIQAGAVRDSLIGVRFVDGQGTIIKNGGRVMKNVTGYDLVKLICGSYGTLGVLSEVAFKLLPKPEKTGVLKINGLEDNLAISLLSKALASPYDVSGAAHICDYDNEGSLTAIRVEGFEKSVDYRLEQLKSQLASYLPKHSQLEIEKNQKAAISLWQSIAEVRPLQKQAGSIWKISTKPSMGPQLVKTISEKFNCKVVYDWGGGLIWLLVKDEPIGSGEFIRQSIGDKNGHATLVKNASGEGISAFHPEHPRLAEISEKLRGQFDPKQILNPGKMSGSGMKAN